jgi:hypothetical protein
MGIYPANLDSINFIGGFVYAKPGGIVIIKDINSTTADTSAYFRLSNVNGINVNDGKNFLVYPNPVSETLFIESINSSTKGNLKLVDVLGQTIYQKELDGNAEIDFRDFKNGIYFLQINYGNHLIRKKVVKN